MSILNTIHYLFVASCLVGSVGCGLQEGARVPTETVNPAGEQVPSESPAEVASNPEASPSPSVSPIASPIPLTVYSLTKVVVTSNGATVETLYGTGSCVKYNAKDYCWDDGIKYLSQSNPQDGGYTFWGMDSNEELCPAGGNGNCKSDLFTQPILMTSGINQILFSYPGVNNKRSVSQVYAQGTTSQVTCTLDDTGLLDCSGDEGTFTVDTLQ